jgi:hypothetical protein
MTQTRTPTQKAQKLPTAGTRTSPRLQPSGSIKLTGRGAVVALFGVCCFGLLVAAWTGWSALADATFVMSCGVVTYHTRASGLRVVVVSPPLAFLGGCVFAEALTAPDTFLAAEGTLVALGTSAPWLFTGTALTFVIAFGRGYRPEVSALPLISNLREALRNVLSARPARNDRRVRGR